VETGYRIRAQVFRTGATGPLQLSADDHSRQLARQSLGIPNAAFLVSCICILMPHRRVQDILHAIARLEPTLRRSTYFLHAGGAASELSQRVLEAIAKELDLGDRVRFLGPLPEIDRIRLLKASNAFVFPVERQSWGLAPLEALANGVPTIISSASGVAEVLRAGVHVECYEPGDIETLAGHLRLLQADPQRGERLARLGRQRWEKRFTWNRAARRLSRRLGRLPSPGR
jgi:glycosyltransferase involved in cell wall biosynthesis